MVDEEKWSEITRSFTISSSPKKEVECQYENRLVLSGPQDDVKEYSSRNLGYPRLISELESICENTSSDRAALQKSQPKDQFMRNDRTRKRKKLVTSEEQDINDQENVTTKISGISYIKSRLGDLNRTLVKKNRTIEQQELVISKLNRQLAAYNGLDIDCRPSESQQRLKTVKPGSNNTINNLQINQEQQEYVVSDNAAEVCGVKDIPSTIYYSSLKTARAIPEGILPIILHRLDALEKRLDQLLKNLPRKVQSYCEEYIGNCQFNYDESGQLIVHPPSRVCNKQLWNKSPIIKPKSNMASTLRQRFREEYNCDNQAKGTSNKGCNKIPENCNNIIDSKLCELEKIVENLKVGFVTLLIKRGKVKHLQKLF